MAPGKKNGKLTEAQLKIADDATDEIMQIMAETRARLT